MTSPDDALYMRMLIERAKELVDTPAPKKEKAKRNITDERKEHLRQRMITLRQNSLATRQANAKLKIKPPVAVKEEVKEVVKEEVKEELKVEPKVTAVVAPVIQAPVIQAPVIQAPVIPAKVYPKYYLPTMKFAKKHGFY
jgi:hypothetical protein